MVVGFLFFVWLVPDRSQPDWVKNAKSRVVLQGTGQWLMSMLPEDPENTILKRLKRTKPEDQDQPDAPVGGRSSLGMPAGRIAVAEPDLRRPAVAEPKSQ
jgi:membrane protein required for colicin V production